MKEPNRRHSLSGAVLIMILTVMAVLIIILMTTLTVVTTANQRIYTKFEENQAYYSARSALDVFTVNLLSDGVHEAYNNAGTAKPYAYGDGSDTSANIMQGLGLQLDLYSIVAQSADSENVKQSDLTTYANSVSDKIEYKTYFGTDSSKVFTDSNGHEYILYNVTFPKMSGENTDEPDGRMSDGNDNIIGGTAIIKVEVMNRIYNLGTYKDGGVVKDPPAYNPSDPAAVAARAAFFAGDQSNVAEAIANGNRKKDIVQIKITATTYFDGIEGTAVLVCNNSEIPSPPNDSNNAITAFGSASSDNMSIIGGASMADNVTWGNDGFIYGAIYAEQDFEVGAGTGPFAYLYEGESFFVGGNFRAGSDHFHISGMYTGTDQNARPFFYVDQVITTSGMNNPWAENVDIISKGITATNNFKVDDCNIYCAGDIHMNTDGVAIDGDLYVEGDIYLANNASGFKYDGSNIKLDDVSGTVHLNGKIYANGGGSPLYDSTVDDPDAFSLGGKLVNMTETFAANLPDIADVRDPHEGSETVELNLPGGITKHIPTHGSSFNTYYRKDAAGNLLDNPPVPVSPQEKLETMLSITDTSLPLTPTNLGITTKMSDIAVANSGTFCGTYDVGGGTIETLSGYSYNYELVTAPGSLTKCYLDDSDASGTPAKIRNQGLHITGGGTAVIVLQPNHAYGNGTRIYVDNDTTLIVVADCTTGDVSFASESYIYDETTAIAHMATKPSTFNGVNVGGVQKPGYTIRVPQINYYVSGTVAADGSTHTFSLDSGAGFLTGYFYGPSVRLNVVTASWSSDYNYNGEPVGNKRIAVVGSVVAHTVNMPNQTGVAYINPDIDTAVDTNDAGKPLYSWSAYRYERL